METVIIILILLSIIAGAIAGLGGSSAFIPIVGLITLTSLSQTEISGTISTSFLIATLFGSLLYTISGDQSKDLLVYIVPFGIVGTQVGVKLNTIISESVFTSITGATAIVLGIILYKNTKLDKNKESIFTIDSFKSKAGSGILGLFVGIIAGVTGIGGIPIIVPALLVLNVDHMTSIATGFTVASFNTFFTSVSYFTQGVVQFEYVLYIGVPFAIAQIIGWKYAKQIDIDGLKIGISVFNIFLGIYLFLRLLL